MTITIIGGDRLGNIPARLEENGFTQVAHLTGRKQISVEKQLCGNTDLVLVLTDFVGTDLSRSVKQTAKKQGVSVAFSRRAWFCISGKIKEHGYLKSCNNCARCGWKGGRTTNDS